MLYVMFAFPTETETALITREYTLRVLTSVAIWRPRGRPRGHASRGSYAPSARASRRPGCSQNGRVLLRPTDDETLNTTPCPPVTLIPPAQPPAGRANTTPLIDRPMQLAHLDAASKQLGSENSADRTVLSGS